MKYCFVFIFAFQSVLSFENLSKTDKKFKNVTKFSCKRMNCPPVEEPVCVRMRNKKIGSKTKDIHIILLNRCEMEYMKCHQDYQATEVSMKNCGHYNKSLGQSGKLRAKRQTLKGIKEKRNHTDGTATIHFDNQGNVTEESLKFKPLFPKSILGDISIFGPAYGIEHRAQQNKESTPAPSSEVASNNEDKENVEKKEEDDSEKSNEASERENIENTVDNQEGADIITIEKYNQESEETTPGPLLDSSSNEEKSDNESMEKTKEATNSNDGSDSNKGFSDDNVTPESYIVQLESNGEESQSTQSDSEEEPVVNVKTEDSAEDTKNSVNTEEDSSVSHSVHYPIDTSEIEGKTSTQYANRKTTRRPGGSAQFKNANDYDVMAANKGVDFEEYGKECPTVCPAAEVMLCGRCKDGVYRTFMSICHLRMFNCQHPSERVELVTRFPCILSAPYLKEGPPPQGRVSQPGDKDVVLQFIRCKEKKNRGNGDDERTCD